MWDRAGEFGMTPSLEFHLAFMRKNPFAFMDLQACPKSTCRSSRLLCRSQPDPSFRVADHPPTDKNLVQQAETDVRWAA